MLYVLLLTVFSDGFKDSEMAWREARLERLKADDGWLNLIGFHWLEEGATRFGSAQDMDLILPKHSTVAHAGTIYYEDGKVRYEMERAQLAKLNGDIKNAGTLSPGPPADILAHNHIRIFLVERDDRLALRIRDLRAKTVTDFEGIDYYKPKSDFVIEAEYEAYDEPDFLWVTTKINTQVMMQVPGELTFEIDDQVYTLLPFLEETDAPKRFFIIFKDTTSGKETYPAGRYLYSDIPEDGGPVVLNFNRAYNPPCAFTDYATCPLPPSDNWLDVAVEAGEKYPVDAHGN